MLNEHRLVILASELVFLSHHIKLRDIHIFGIHAVDIITKNILLFILANICGKL